MIAGHLDHGHAGRVHGKGNGVVVWVPALESMGDDDRGSGEQLVQSRREVGQTVGGLLVHCAEHTQRHAGQMVVTAKLVGGGLPRDGAEGTA